MLSGKIVSACKNNKMPALRKSTWSELFFVILTVSHAKSIINKGVILHFICRGRWCIIQKIFYKDSGLMEIDT